MIKQDIQEKFDKLKAVIDALEDIIHPVNEDIEEYESVKEIKSAIKFLFKIDMEELDVSEDFYKKIQKNHASVNERKIPNYSCKQDFSFHIGYEIGRLYQKLKNE